MTRSRRASPLLGAGMFWIAVLFALPAISAKLENTFYAASTSLFLKVPDAALRKLLPQGWEPAPVPAMQGGNLTVTFTDILASETPDSRPGETARAVWLSAPVQKSGGSERAGVVLGGFASNSAFVPGPYGNYVLAQTHLDRRRQAEAAGASVSENWRFVAENGAKIEFSLAFSEGPALRLNPPESKVVSATKPNLRRINKTDVVAQQLRPGDAKELTVTASGPLLSSLFDGSQQIVAVISAPWLMTRVLVP